MNDFGRVLRIAARNRWSLLGVLTSSFIIALLWGANIGTLYPMVEVVFQGESIPEYAERRILETDEMVGELEGELLTIKEQLKTSSGNERQELSLRAETISAKRDVYLNSVDYLRRFQPWINEHAPGGPYQTLVLIVTVLLAGTFIKLAALLSNLLLVQNISQRTSLELRSRFFRKALQLDLDFFGDNGSANLTSRLTNDINHIAEGVNILLGRLVREPLKMIVCLGGAIFVCPRLLLLVLVVVPILGVVMAKLSRAIRRASRKAMEEMTQLYGMLNDAFAGIRVVKAFNTQGKERAKFQIGAGTYYRKSMKVAFYNTFARSSSELFGISTVCLAILAGGYLVVNRETHLLGMQMSSKPLSVGEILMFFGFLIGASDPARKLSEVWAGLQKGVAAADRIFEIIDQPVRVTEPSKPKTSLRGTATVEFENIHYEYPKGPHVLRGLNCQINQGETIAIIGPNGSGKSTLISLLCRFDDPLKGSVKLNGVPINEMGLRDLRRRIALVTQRTILFDETIENNIRYGTPGASSEEVIAAAKMAFADDFIRDKTPDGYQTVLGTQGVRLSGGQMQRIALARAFLKNPDILILDEATSQIDLESEQLIHTALSDFLVDRTGLMITHRSTSMAMADRILVVESGAISDSGTHQELIGRNRFYQSLCGNERNHAA
ncbi:MAG: ABC transporter ATP-binding protein [Planctomycetota bacterium]|nr:ABC transporter ATP-binding protein [Planctomycetota bacterium]